MGVKPLNNHPVTMAEALTYLDEQAEAVHHSIERRAQRLGRTGLNAVNTENDRMIERDLMKEDVRDQAVLAFIIKLITWQPIASAPGDTLVLVKMASGNLHLACRAKQLVDPNIQWVDQDGAVLANPVGWRQVID